MGSGPFYRGAQRSSPKALGQMKTSGSEVNFTNAHFTGETLTNAGTAGLHAR
jgi:hypothetical protein